GDQDPGAAQGQYCGESETSHRGNRRPFAQWRVEIQARKDKALGLWPRTTATHTPRRAFRSMRAMRSGSRSDRSSKPLGAPAQTPRSAELAYSPTRRRLGTASRFWCVRTDAWATNTSWRSTAAAPTP